MTYIQNVRTFGGRLGTLVLDAPWFWSLWSAFTTSNLGDGLSLVAFPLLAITLTDDARLHVAAQDDPDPQGRSPQFHHRPAMGARILRRS